MKHIAVYQAVPLPNQRYFTQNARILKLIQAKMQPLQKSNSMRPLLPKIRPLPTSPKKEEKKYVEIEIKEEEGIAGTDIEQEHKYKMENKRAKSRLNSISSHQNILKLIQPYHAAPRITQLPGKGGDWSFQDGIFQEEKRNRQRLERIQQEIDSCKQRFVNSIKFTECAGDYSGKENCSFEYLVNRIEAERQEKSTKKPRSSAFEAISPNKLSHYITLLQSPRNSNEANIQEGLQDAAAIEVKPRKNQMKRRTTIIASDNHEVTEHVASKLRLKANHRRLIEHNK